MKTQNTNTKKVALVIFVGWGENPSIYANAIENSYTPFYNELKSNYPSTLIGTHGKYVGLPEGQMGNSEVGHFTIGTGRILKQPLDAISDMLQDPTIFSPALNEFLSTAPNRNNIHLIGLLSDGGVHSHIHHLLALIPLLENNQNTKIWLHLFLDGRDVAPKSALLYLEQLKPYLSERVCIASLAGRYFGMDRDHRWERTNKSLEVILPKEPNGKTFLFKDPLDYVQQQYAQGETDEFISPAASLDYSNNYSANASDAFLFFNFRTDRCRQITSRCIELFPHSIYTMTEYDKEFDSVSVLYTKPKVTGVLGEVLSKAGKTQLRLAETEKYPHVTFFFNGGREQVFKGESRVMVPSPKVPTYDLQPEMSAYMLTDKLVEALQQEDSPEFICINFANTDMVGHTGVLSAGIEAAEHVDRCLSSCIPELLKKNYEVLITADHGNAEFMKNKDGSPHTAHTLFPVRIIYCSSYSRQLKDGGGLSDIAPSILEILNIPAPHEMNGSSLFKS